MLVRKKEVEKYLKKWQNILRLRDWDIIIKIVKKKWRKSGDIKIDMEDKKAALLVNHKSKCENLEELIVHELLHVKLYGMDQMIDGLISIMYGKKKSAKKEFAYAQFMSLLESTVEDLTKSYLTLGGNRRSISFGRLQNEINEELKSA